MFSIAVHRSRPVISASLIALAVLPAAAQTRAAVDDASPTLGADRSGPSSSGYNFLGGLVVGPLDVQSPPAPDNAFVYGVEHAFGHYWVTGGDGSATLNAGLIYKYDLNGNLLAQFPQTSIASSAFGHRDGECDELAKKFWWGEESNRIVEYDYDSVGGGLTFNRVYSVTNPLPPPNNLLPGTVRCLARNPLNGRFYTANFGSPVWELAINTIAGTATVTRQYANPTAPNVTAFAGLAWDHGAHTLWGWSQNGFPAVQGIELTVGATTITPTGRAFQGANQPLQSIAGGADIYFDARNPGFLSLVGCHQATPDSIAVYDTATVFTPAPYHDDCANAAFYPCGSPPATVSTVSATPDSVPACGPAPAANGVWFRFAGTGFPITLSTCDPATSFDTRITVFTGTCGGLACVGDNDDVTCGANPLASSLTFNSTYGVAYRALVHGGKLASDVGTFRLTLTCPDYCLAATTSICGAGLEYITRVRLGVIDNATPVCTPGGYQNFTNLVTAQSILCPDNVIVDTTNAVATDKVTVFVDWNQDLDFNDANEAFPLVGSPPGLPDQFTGSIQSPAGALLGNTRVRVALDDSPVVSACGVSTFADFQDYTVNVLPIVDGDGDGTPDCLDGCPSDPGKTAPGVCGCGVPDTDSDGDGTPDCIDLCPDDPNKIDPGICGCNRPDIDTDGDGTPNCIDGCAHDPLKIAPGFCGCGQPETDTDGDGSPDCVDGCPLDPNKITAGFCGCGQPETDTDGDGTPDCVDGCPLDPLKVVAGFCGCGIPDTDGDGDGTPDCADNCPNFPNPTQLDTDSDGHGDACDNCPLHPNPDQHDCDHNGVGDVCEIANGAQPDCNLNGLPDNCEQDCNGNGVQDDCDIASATSQDLNVNGIPDECEGPGIPFCFGDGTGTPCPCGNNSTTGKGCMNSTNRGGQLYNSGSTSVSLDDSRVTAIFLPANKVTIFFMGQMQLNGGLGVPFYDGLACVKPLKRFPAVTSDLQGLADIVQPVLLSNGIITAGSTWYFQGWFRDNIGSVCGTNANLTNGLGVSFTP